jgi:hypothetical protein
MTHLYIRKLHLYYYCIIYINTSMRNYSCQQYFIHYFIYVSKQIIFAINTVDLLSLNDYDLLSFF